MLGAGGDTKHVSCTQGNRTGCQYEPSAGRISINDAEEKGYELKGCEAGTGTPKNLTPNAWRESGEHAACNPEAPKRVTATL